MGSALMQLIQRLFEQNGLKMKTNYQNGLIKKIFSKMGDFCHIEI